jgi:alkyl sulfatase BDS1-like metallo-beta-lactamase superfamily hydrolase
MKNNYLTNIPQDVEKYGLCKTLLVRREVIHLKHILTELFVRKTFDVQTHLEYLDWSILQYIEHITNRMRKVHHFSRTYTNNINDIVKQERDRFSLLLTYTKD